MGQGYYSLSQKEPQPEGRQVLLDIAFRGSLYFPLRISAARRQAPQFSSDRVLTHAPIGFVLIAYRTLEIYNATGNIHGGRFCGFKLVSCIANMPNKIMSVFDADLAWMEQGDTEVSSVPAKTKAAQKEA
ncbi:MAG: hypothetical protein A2X45_18030 [Lentisphaerae bacterium GWF2_50_93]|nr:MAG: hypothetical protein A2X45_18030 [Lentisphaerae bacterium GWF2_50_93]